MVSAGSPVFVIAEAGVNHNGSVELAHRLIDTAADLGANAVKFQTFEPDLLAATAAPTAAYQRATTGADSQPAMLESLMLPAAAWSELAAHAADRAIAFMSTAFDEPSLDRLLGVGVTRLKIPSGELTNLSFIERVASCGLPVVMSTGMGDLREVQSAVSAAENAADLTLLHCVSAYPAPIEDANLGAITTMRSATGLPVGWSDHCRGTVAASIAVALGASVIERHLTLDHKMTGPDHAASDDPAEFDAYLAAIAQASVAIGDGVKRARPSEIDVRSVARRGWHAKRELVEGATVTADDVVALRPATGIGVDTSIVGGTVLRGVGRGSPILPADVQLVAPTHD